MESQNECTVEEKWQQTGLLEESTNPSSLAHVLEAAATAVVNAAPSLQEDHIKYMMTTSLPILTRALRTRNFTTNMVESGVVTEAVFIKETLDESSLIEECVRAGAVLSKTLDKYEALNVMQIKISEYNGGYHIGLDCSSSLQ